MNLIPRLVVITLTVLFAVGVGALASSILANHGRVIGYTFCFSGVALFMLIGHLMDRHDAKVRGYSQSKGA